MPSGSGHDDCQRRWYKSQNHRTEKSPQYRRQCPFTTEPGFRCRDGLGRLPGPLGHRPDGGHAGIRGASGGVIHVIDLTQGPLQLRRNWQPFGERPQAVEKLGTLLSGHRKPDPEPSGLGIRSAPTRKTRSRTAAPARATPARTPSCRRRRSLLRRIASRPLACGGSPVSARAGRAGPRCCTAAPTLPRSSGMPSPRSPQRLAPTRSGVPAVEHRQRLGQKRPCAVGHSGMTGPSRGLQQPSALA